MNPIFSCTVYSQHDDSVWASDGRWIEASLMLVSHQTGWVIFPNINIGKVLEQIYSLIAGKKCWLHKLLYTNLRHPEDCLCNTPLVSGQPENIPGTEKKGKWWDVRQVVCFPLLLLPHLKTSGSVTLNLLTRVEVPPCSVTHHMLKLQQKTQN